MIRINDKSRDGIYSSNMELIDNFTDYSSKNLDFDKPVEIDFLDDEENAKNPLGSTAHYNPDEMKITIYVTGRHLKDILRSISHELIHHVQNCRGDLDHGANKLGYAQDDKHMRGMEHEAYTMGNIMNFRDFEDNYKRGKKMSINEFKLKKQLNSTLMKEQLADIQKQQDNQAATQDAMAPSDAPSRLSPGGGIEKKAVYQTASDIGAALRDLVRRRNSFSKNAKGISKSQDYAGVSDLPQIAKAFTDKVDALNDAALRKSLAIPELDGLSVEQIQNQTFKNVQNKMAEIYKAYKTFFNNVENLKVSVANRSAGAGGERFGPTLDILEAYQNGINIFGRVVAKVYKAASGKRRKSPAVAKGKGQGKAVGTPAGPQSGGAGTQRRRRRAAGRRTYKNCDNENVIRIRCKGKKVELIQKLLGISVDGKFWTATRRAVKKFQRENKLTPDGAVGDKTFAALKARAAGAKKPGATPAGGAAQAGQAAKAAQAGQAGQAAQAAKKSTAVILPIKSMIQQILGDKNKAYVNAIAMQYLPAELRKLNKPSKDITEDEKRQAAQNAVAAYKRDFPKALKEGIEINFDEFTKTLNEHKNNKFDDRFNKLVKAFKK